MALTQMQIIQSLGEAMAWFERELNWGVPPTELRHLCGRIGELYVALISNGRMATEINQKGYDVVGSDGQHISVKTTAMIGTGGHVMFNANSLQYVDRVIVLRVNTDEMQIETLLDEPIDKAIALMAPDGHGKKTLSLGRLTRKPAVRVDLKAVKEVSYQGYIIRELENGSIEVERAGKIILPVKPVLRDLALQLNIGLLNNNDNALNTRQLGSQIIKSVQALVASGAQPGVPAELRYNAGEAR